MYIIYCDLKTFISHEFKKSICHKMAQQIDSINLFHLDLISGKNTLNIKLCNPLVIKII
jgi:hypothetical protein